MHISRLDTASARRRLSPLLVRILAVNVLALAILVGGVLYLGSYRERLITAELDLMLLQARLSASAIGEGAVVIDREEQNILSPLLARLMIRRLMDRLQARVLLFDSEESLLADSRVLEGKAGDVVWQDLPPPLSDIQQWTDKALEKADRLWDYFWDGKDFPHYFELSEPGSATYNIVQKAALGDAATQVWRQDNGQLLLTVAMPVQRYRQVLGVVMLSRPDTGIDNAVREVRYDILRIFAFALLITVLLSFYLARTIASPLRMLAQAAEEMRQGQSESTGLVGMAGKLTYNAIPDFSSRKDEIGDLSAALRDLTVALARRVEAIENFAADVAHEIKNPLASMRSAIETASRISDPEQKSRMLDVVRDDVHRMDRLLNDIANASRLDAELGRAEMEIVDIGRMLETLADFHNRGENGEETRSPRVVVESPEVTDGSLVVSGVEGRLVQVLENLLSNALSFSPPYGKVTLAAIRDGAFVRITVADEGPGIPQDKLSAVFERFYSERPKGEKFGLHSGLGLSIVKQIVAAHRGTISATNRHDEHGRVIGAEFVVTLPMARNLSSTHHPMRKGGDTGVSKESDGAV